MRINTDRTCCRNFPQRGYPAVLQKHLKHETAVPRINSAGTEQAAEPVPAITGDELRCAGQTAKAAIQFGEYVPEKNAAKALSGNSEGIAQLIAD